MEAKNHSVFKAGLASAALAAAMSAPAYGAVDVYQIDPTHTYPSIEFSRMGISLKTEVCGADAEGELNWSEYGMKMSKWGEGEAGRVRLRIQVEALKRD